MTHIISQLSSIFIGKKKQNANSLIATNCYLNQCPPTFIIPSLWCWRILHDVVQWMITHNNWCSDVYCKQSYVTSGWTGKALKHRKITTTKIMKCRGRLDKTNPAELPPLYWHEAFESYCIPMLNKHGSMTMDIHGNPLFSKASTSAKAGFQLLCLLTRGSVNRFTVQIKKVWQDWLHDCSLFYENKDITKH